MLLKNSLSMIDNASHICPLDPVWTREKTSFEPINQHISQLSWAHIKCIHSQAKLFGDRCIGYQSIIRANGCWNLLIQHLSEMMILYRSNSRVRLQIGRYTYLNGDPATGDIINNPSCILFFFFHFSNPSEYCTNFLKSVTNLVRKTTPLIWINYMIEIDCVQLW